MNGAFSAVRIQLEWQPRSPPLPPCAALAIGATRARLAARLLALPEARLARLAGCASERCLLVLGNAEDLPWVDGLSYLGKDEACPRLLLPTALSPSVPAALLERAVLARAVLGTAASGSWAVNASPALIVPTASARRIERRALEALGAPR